LKREKSAARNLQQASIGRRTRRAAGDKAALILRGEAYDKQREQGADKQRGEFGGERKGVHFKSLERGGPGIAPLCRWNNNTAWPGEILSTPRK